MEKRTLEELMILADQSLSTNMDLHIILEHPDGSKITIFLADVCYEIVEVDYYSAAGKRETSDEYWGSWNQGDLCRYWGLDPDSTEWFINYQTFLQLNDIESHVEELRKNLSPYKED